MFMGVGQMWGAPISRERDARHQGFRSGAEVRAIGNTGP